MLVALVLLELLVEFGSGGRRQRRLDCPRARIAFVVDTTVSVAQLAFVECVASVVVAAVVDDVVDSLDVVLDLVGSSFELLELVPLLAPVGDACPGSSLQQPFVAESEHPPFRLHPDS